MPSSQGCQRDSESHVQNSSEERSVQLVVSPSPGLGARGGGPPLPPTRRHHVCGEVACCRQSSPAHLPFYRPAHNRGKPGRRRGRRQMENKERTKALLPRGQKAGALLPPPVLASLSSPAPVPPQASGHLPRPSRLALASQGVPHLLGDPQKVSPLQATFFLSVNEEDILLKYKK